MVDPQARTLCPGERIGEIWVSGTSLAQGYWEKPEESQAVFQAHLDNGEGPFLCTGDLGFIRDHELFITGRLKELIIFEARNIYPQDIERFAEQSQPALQPAGGAAFVVGRNGEEEIVLAHEIKRSELKRLDVEEVVDATRTAVTNHLEVPIHTVTLLKPGTIPKTSSGKIQRFACRTGFLEGRLDRINL